MRQGESKCMCGQCKGKVNKKGKEVRNEQLVERRVCLHFTLSSWGFGVGGGSMYNTSTIPRRHFPFLLVRPGLCFCDIDSLTIG